MALLNLRDFFFLGFCVFLHFLYRYRRKPLVPLPPSLPGWPLVGNAFQIPLTYQHIFYKELGQRLRSKIMYLEALGRPIIVINDINMAKDLLEKRSGLYSSRPTMAMINEVIKIDVLFGTLPYSDTWRNHRRIFQQHFSPKKGYRQEKKALEFVRKALLPNLYHDPEYFHDHVRGCIGGLSMNMTYGLPIRRVHDPLIDKAEKYLTSLTAAVAPGKYLVNVLPVLKYVPDWMPGATFKKEARETREQMIEMIELPYQETLKLMDNGTFPECFVSESLERCTDWPDSTAYKQDIKHVAAQIFSTTSETTVTATMTFILAMLTHPDVQRKAQEEVDSVTGLDRLPEFSDQPYLPYLAAVIKEVLRWNPTAPFGVPHMTTKDDIYEGYYIPKDCTIFVNTYAILHDESLFPNPTEFHPERFIQEGVLLTDVLDPSTEATFGFGRRICPGSHIAMSALYIIAASILALFDISPALDTEGQPIEVTPKFISASIISEPLPFKCKFVPRSKKNIESILREYLDVDVVE